MSGQGYQQRYNTCSPWKQVSGRMLLVDALTTVMSQQKCLHRLAQATGPDAVAEGPCEHLQACTYSVAHHHAATLRMLQTVRPIAHTAIAAPAISIDEQEDVQGEADESRLDSEPVQCTGGCCICKAATVDLTAAQGRQPCCSTWTNRLRRESHSTRDSRSDSPLP